jgi:hypothetical protein
MYKFYWVYNLFGARHVNAKIRQGCFVAPDVITTFANLKVEDAVLNVWIPE